MRSAMNIFKTLILISVIQISGIITNISWESIQLTKLAGKVCVQVKHETSTKIVEANHDMRVITKDELQVQNTPICRKEVSLKNSVPQVVSSDKSKEVPVTKASGNDQQTIRKSSAMGLITFNGTVSAELF